jgi:tetrahydromethanopterin S-methyltransferase subunit G
MAVMAREAWTDERLDDLNKKVDNGFARVDRSIAEVKAETGERFDRLETRMERGFSELNQRLDRMQIALIAALVTFCVTLIGSCATLAGVALF